MSVYVCVYILQYGLSSVWSQPRSINRSQQVSFQLYFSLKSKNWNFLFCKAYMEIEMKIFIFYFLMKFSFHLETLKESLGMTSLHFTFYFIRKHCFWPPGHGNVERTTSDTLALRTHSLSRNFLSLHIFNLLTPELSEKTFSGVSFGEQARGEHAHDPSPPMYV